MSNSNSGSNSRAATSQPPLLDRRSLLTRLSQNPLVSLVGRAVSGCPLATRALVYASGIALVPTVLPLAWANDALVNAAALCAEQLHQTDTLWSLYRFLAAPLVHTSFVGGALSVFALLQLGPRIEQQRGTLAFILLVALTFLLTQAAHLLVGAYAATSPVALQLARACHLNLDATRADQIAHIPLWGAHPNTLEQSELSWASLFSFAIPTQACSVNNWAILFALIVYECNKLTRDRTRFVFLIPFAVPTRIVPLILLLAYQLWFGVQLHTLIGFLVGYAFCMLPFLTLPPWVLRNFEPASWRRHPSFISVDRAGTMQPWRHYVPDEQATTTGPSNSAKTQNGAPPPAYRSPTGSGDSSSASSSDEEESFRSSSYSPSKSAAASLRNATAPPMTSVAHTTPSADAAHRTAVLAANVARILDVQAFPKQPPRAGEIQLAQAHDEQNARQ